MEDQPHPPAAAAGPAGAEGAASGWSADADPAAADPAAASGEVSGAAEVVKGPAALGDGAARVAAAAEFGALAGVLTCVRCTVGVVRAASTLLLGAEGPDGADGVGPVEEVRLCRLVLRPSVPVVRPDAPAPAPPAVDEAGDERWVISSRKSRTDWASAAEGGGLDAAFAPVPEAAPVAPAPAGPCRAPVAPELERRVELEEERGRGGGAPAPEEAAAE